MTLNLSIPGQDHDLRPRITVFGVGGAGGNAVNNMIEKRLEGVEFVVANTDAQALQQSRADNRIQMGVKVTEGLGAGARAEVGAAAAEESIEQIIDHLAGAHMCFITAGMGGGTGTGAAPIIAQAARELGVLTVGVVTKPFQFEGAKRMRQAEAGIEALQKVVDTLIIIPNQNLFRLANEKTTFTEAFAMADDVLYQGVKGVTDLMVRPGLINLDFADVRAVMDEMGKAMMGTGEASGEDRAVQAAEKAIANPLLDEISLKGAKGVLINITGGYDLTLFELDEAANRIREEVDPDANIIVGSTLDTESEGVMRVSVVATGIDASSTAREEGPVPRRSLREPLQTQSHAPTRQEAPQEPAVAAAHEVEQAVAYADEPEEPSLFEGIDEPLTAGERTRADERREPVVPEFRPRPDAVEGAAEPEVSRAAEPGTPSPETLARLRAAVAREPSRSAPRESAQGDAAGRQPAAEPQQERHARFGIGTLINRMTGHGTPQPAQEAEAPSRLTFGSSRTAQAQAEAADPVDEDDDGRVEIPAFLRRQAN